MRERKSLPWVQPGDSQSRDVVILTMHAKQNAEIVELFRLLAVRRSWQYQQRKGRGMHAMQASDGHAGALEKALTEGSALEAQKDKNSGCMITACRTQAGGVTPCR